MRIAKPKKFASRAEQRAARKRVEIAMAKIAEEAFSDAFNRMFAVSVAEGSPRHSGPFLRWFLKAMKEYAESYPQWGK